MAISDVPAGLLTLDVAIYLWIACLLYLTAHGRPTVSRPNEWCGGREQLQSDVPMAPLHWNSWRIELWLWQPIVCSGKRRLSTRASVLIVIITVLLVGALTAAGVHAYTQPSTQPSLNPVNLREAEMNLEYIIVGLVALFIAIYLTIALLRPDKF